MTVVSIKTNYGGDLVEIRVTGKLAEMFKEAQTASDTLTPFDVLRAAENKLAQARAYTFSCYSGDLAWNQAYELLEKIGFNAKQVDSLKNTEVTMEIIEGS